MFVRERAIVEPVFVFVFAYKKPVFVCERAVVSVEPVFVFVCEYKEPVFVCERAIVCVCTSYCFCRTGGCGCV